MFSNLGPGRAGGLPLPLPCPCPALALPPALPLDGAGRGGAERGGAGRGGAERGKAGRCGAGQDGEGRGSGWNKGLRVADVWVRPLCTATANTTTAEVIRKGTCM